MNRQVFSAAVTVAVATLVVKLFAMLKETAVATQFGLSDALDAFLIAFLVPTFAINIIAQSFSLAFVPTFIQVREQQGRTAAERLFGSVTVLSLVALLIAALLLAATATPLLSLIASEFGVQKKALTLELFYLLLPSIVIYGVVLLWTGVLNAGERFGVGALVPVVTPLSVIFFLLLVGEGWGIHALAWGTLAGMFMELCLLAIAVRRGGIALIPRWAGLSDPLRRVLTQYASVLFGALMMSGATFIDQVMAAWLDPGSVAALNYGGKVSALVAGLGGLAIGTAVLPFFSKLVAKMDKKGIQHSFRTYARLILWVTIPVTTLTIVASEWLVRLLFEHGAFRAEDTAIVAQIQQLYLLKTPFYVLNILAMRLMSALGRNHLVMMVAGAGLVLNIVGNYILMKFLGAAGIALSTSIVYITTSAVICYILLRTRHKVA